MQFKAKCFGFHVTATLTFCLLLQWTGNWKLQSSQSKYYKRNY